MESLREHVISEAQPYLDRLVFCKPTFKIEVTEAYGGGIALAFTRSASEGGIISISHRFIIGIETVDKDTTFMQTKMENITRVYERRHNIFISENYY